MGVMIYGLMFALPVAAISMYIWASITLFILERSSFPIWAACAVGIVLPSLIAVGYISLYVFSYMSGVPNVFFRI